MEKASPGLRTGQYVSPTLGRKHARIQNAIKSQQNIDYSERIHVSSAVKATNIQTDSERRPTEDMIESGGERDYLRQKQQSKAMMAVTGLNNMHFLNQLVKPTGGDLRNLNGNIELVENGVS